MVQNLQKTMFIAIRALKQNKHILRVYCYLAERTVTRLNLFFCLQWSVYDLTGHCASPTRHLVFVFVRSLVLRWRLFVFAFIYVCFTFCVRFVFRYIWLILCKKKFQRRLLVFILVIYYVVIDCWIQFTVVLCPFRCPYQLLK